MTYLHYPILSMRRRRNLWLPERLFANCWAVYYFAGFGNHVALLSVSSTPSRFA